MDPINMPPWIPCPHCNRGLPVIKEISFAYFHGVKPECPSCKKSIDWWDAILKAVKSKFFIGQILAPVGARSVLFEIELVPNRTTEVKFAEHGIPSNAKILDLNYNPKNGGLFPLEFHGNNPPRHLIRHEIALYPAVLPGHEPKVTKVMIYATWIPYEENNESWQSLVDAFEAYSQERYNSCIVPANVAVESKLGKLLTRYLLSFASKDNVEEFLENGATYSHQLNVMLPVVTTHIKAPSLSENIRGTLNRLRRYRNDIAHTGKTEKDIEREDAAQLVVAGLFGVHYLHLLEQEIEKQQPE